MKYACEEVCAFSHHIIIVPLLAEVKDSRDQPSLASHYFLGSTAMEGRKISDNNLFLKLLDNVTSTINMSKTNKNQQGKGKKMQISFKFFSLWFNKPVIVSDT